MPGPIGPFLASLRWESAVPVFCISGSVTPGAAGDVMNNITYHSVHLNAIPFLTQI